MSTSKELHRIASKAVDRFKIANAAFKKQLAELHRQESRRAEVLAASERQAEQAEQARQSWRESIKSTARSLLTGTGAPRVVADPERLRGQQAEAARDEAQAVAAEFDVLIAEQREVVRLADAARLAAHFQARLTLHQATRAELVETCDPLLHRLIALQRASSGPRNPSLFLPDLTGADLTRRLSGVDTPATVDGLELNPKPFDLSGDFPALFSTALDRAA